MPEEHISTASWVEICDNSPSVHRLPQVANPWLPRTTSLGRQKPAPVVSTAPQWKPTRPSLVGAKNPDDSEDMDTQPSSLKRKDPPPDSYIFKVARLIREDLILSVSCVFLIMQAILIFVLFKRLLARPDAIKLLSSRWPGSSFWSPAISKQGGVEILISEHVPGKVLSWRKDSGVGLLVCLFPLMMLSIILSIFMRPPILQITNPFLKLYMNSFSQLIFR